MSQPLPTASRHSCDSPDWYTPKPFVEAARDVMGGIDLDPASDAEANRVVRATNYYTEQTNGLRYPWQGRVFLNPPGGQVADFWVVLIENYRLGTLTEGIWVGYSLEQLQTLQQAGVQLTPLDFPICVPKRRIAFVENEARRLARIKKLTEYNAARVALGGKPKRISEKADSPSHANYITYLGPQVAKFELVFSRFGKVKR